VKVRPAAPDRAAAYLRDAARRRGASLAAFVPRELNEECGVFGIIGTSDAAALTALGLHALQHRGQEGAGIVVHDPAAGVFRTERRLGLVADSFSDAATLASLAGTSAIGHTRYSTQGDTVLRNVQPLYADLDRTGVAVSHNGNLTNAHTLKTELVRRGCIFQSTSDSELFLQLTARSHQLSIVDKLIDALKQVEGAYALAVLTKDALIGARDPVGIRPLILGDLNGAAILASETCALDLIGARFVRDIRPGEVVIARGDGRIESRQAFPAPPRARPCFFELIYFARPNSFVDGRSVYDIRKRLGAQLALEAPSTADLVAPIPDSGVPAAIGYAQASGLPYEMALIRSHFVGRTFIEPQQRIREAGVKRKHSPNRGVIAGKRIVLIDDSIVRGTTARKIASLMRDAGAREVHLRVACPPIKHPDFYGINTPSYEELLAHGRDVAEMRADLGVDSLAFLSVDGLYEAVERRPRDASAPAYTDHCFTGDYPTRLTDQSRADRDAMIEQLSFLAETS
jgi:amidophosphoribosyltransferase